MLQSIFIVVKTSHALVGQVAVITLARVLSSGGARGWKSLSDGNIRVSRDLMLELHGGGGPREQPDRHQQQRHCAQPSSCSSVTKGSCASAGQDISLLPAVA